MAVVAAVAVLALYAVPSQTGGAPGRQAAATGGFAADWSALVRAYATETARVQQSARSAAGSDVGAMLAVYRELQQSTARSLADFQALTPPASAAAEYDAFVGLLEEGHEDLRQVVRAAEADDAAALAAQISELASDLAALVSARAAVDAALQDATAPA